MKFNKVNEVVKVFNADHETESPVKDIGVADKSNDGVTQVYKRMRPKQGLDAASGKRKTWRTETSKVFDANPIENTKQGSGLSNNMEEQCKDLSVFVDETERSPNESSLGVSELSEKMDEQCRELSASADGDKRCSVKVSRQKSEVGKNMDEKCKELSDSVDGIKRSPTQIAKKRSEWSKNSDEQTKELSVSVDGIKNSPSKIRKTRSELIRELSVSVDGMEKSPNRSMRTRAMSQKESKGPGNESDRSSVQLRKVKSVSSKASNVGNEGNAGLRKTRSEAGKDSNVPGNSREGVSSQLVKFESLSDKVVGVSRRISTESRDSQFESIELVDESEKVLDESAVGIKDSSIGIAKYSYDENCEELIEYEEKTITSDLGNVSAIKPPPKLEVTEDEDGWDEELEEEFDEDIETETIKKSFDVIEISIPEQKAKKIVIEEKKIQESNLRSAPIWTTVKQTPPVAIHPGIVSKPTKTTPIPVADEYYSVPKRHSKLQSLVDLVMWRDVSKSAFIFGLGTFVLMSSSYTTDLNISIISVVSYVGLIYLAVTFLVRSIIYREIIQEDGTGQEYVFGVEEAIWLLKMILPYINEFLLKLRALFSGDPATTMKLAVLLFVLARCGSSITIWKMAKLGFFGAFTVPKICSSYSSQLTAFGTFWLRRVGDAWESCSHKKAVGFFIFTLIWNLSSVVARIWAVFMLFVAFKYYQQTLSDGEEWIKDDKEEEEISGRSASEKKNKNTKQIIGGRTRRQGPGPTLLETKKQKKPIS